MKIFLGTDDPTWIGRSTVPLFISVRRDMMTSRTRFGKRASLEDWALDSGGFTQIQRGGWTMPPAEYLDRVYTLADRCPGMAWAAPQDWMCEPPSLAATGKTVQEHQRLTVENYLALREIDERGLIIPVVQGWTPGQHELCVEMYLKAGVDLRDHRLVGVGTVCRRQATDEVEGIVRRLASYGLSLDGFGIKMKGLQRYASCLTSCDSMAWTYRAWKSSRDGNPPLCGDGTHRVCNHCFKWAHIWHDRATAATVP